MQTALEEKKRAAKEFFGHVEQEIVSGGEKYALSPDMEATDFILDALPGKTGIDSLLSDILRYTIRFINLGAERDLLKIGACAGLAWARKFGLKERKPDNPKPKRRRSQKKKAEAAGADVPAVSSGGGNG